MKKDYYIDKLEDCKEQEIDIVVSIAGDDPEVSSDDLLEIEQEADNIKDVIRIERCEAADDRYNEDWTDDELGLTQM